jgi:hypothetical protein
MSEEKQQRAGRGDEDRADERVEERDPESGGRDIEIPAIRHIGRTLESDPEYYAIVSPGYSTPEAQIAAEAGPIDADQRQIQEDDFDSLSGRTLEDHPEKLKTRLPGDTSSEPHTDVGPDNATTLQNEEDIPRSAKSDRA